VQGSAPCFFIFIFQRKRMYTRNCFASVRHSAACAVAALLLTPLAYAAGPGGGGGGQSGRAVSAPTVITVPTPVPGTNIVIPAGTPIGSVVGFATAVPGFPAAPITLQPNRTNGRPFGAP
jgi:hypothetical protein